jgi:polyisoprenoid-binding protein YceI
MKNALRQAFLAGLFLLFGAASACAADTYTLDSNHTNIDWRISHFGFSNPSGKFPGATGTLVLDQANPANSKVTVTIPVGDLITGIPKLDEHLKSKDFFDVANFPTATFESTSVQLTGKDTAKVIGNFTLHGVTKLVTLDVKLNKIGENMMHKQTAGFGATTTLRRSDFGISSYLPGLGDDVTLTIESEANLNP